MGNRVMTASPKVVAAAAAEEEEEEEEEGPITGGELEAGLATSHTAAIVARRHNPPTILMTRVGWKDVSNA
jgi:hypothetical protein